MRFIAGGLPQCRNRSRFEKFVFRKAAGTLALQGSVGVFAAGESQQACDFYTGGCERFFSRRRGKRTSLTPSRPLFQEHARAIRRQFDKSLPEISAQPSQLRSATP
jgi:hypothetical protein